MTEPVWMLPEAGMTVLGTGAVVYRESKAYAAAAFASTSDRDEPSPRALRLSHAMHHELVHHLHSFTTFYLRSFGGDLLPLAVRVLRDAAAGDVATSVAAADLRARFSDLSRRGATGLSVRDLLESSASLEGFRLTTGDLGVPGYEHYLSEVAGPVGSTSPYRRAYDVLADHLGPAPAVRFLAPVTWLALQYAEPVQTFVAFADLLGRDARHASLGQPTPGSPPDAQLKELMSLLGVSLTPLEILQRVVVDDASPMSERCLDWAIGHIGETLLVEEHGPQRPDQAANRAFAQELAAVPVLASIAAQPALLGLLSFGRWLDDVRAPWELFSAAPGDELVIDVHNVLRDADDELRQTFVDATGYLSAAERLTVASDHEGPYHPCPHRSRCRHGATDLCFRYLNPPPPGHGDVEETCWFVTMTVRATGRTPEEVWAARS